MLILIICTYKAIILIAVSSWLSNMVRIDYFYYFWSIRQLGVAHVRRQTLTSIRFPYMSTFKRHILYNNKTCGLGTKKD